MTAVLFVGPSVPAAEREALAGFACRPPVAQGDVYAAALLRPRAIGIVDGYFHGVAAVWHKEILWAMAQGIHVFGASSMGALRAAELHAFGMRGIGRIFEDYRDGVLTDDDEVAVLHGPAEAGYATLTEPMVNIRATLARAHDDGIVSRDALAEIATIAKKQFYQERTWQTVLAAVAASPLDLPVDALRRWLPDGRTDQKHADALAMIAAMTDHLETDPAAMQVNYVFENTEMWANASWRRVDEPGSGLDGDAVAVLDELRLDGDAWVELQNRALLSALACGDVDPDGAPAGHESIQYELGRFRDARGLARRRDIETWAGSVATDIAGVERMVRERARVRDLARANAGRLFGRILDQLRLSGDYGRLSTRARHKAKLLRTVDVEGEDVPAGQSDRLLLEWHFSRFLERDVPEDLDGYVAELGLDDEDFLRLLRGEAIYQKMIADDADEA